MVGSEIFDVELSITVRGETNWRTFATGTWEPNKLGGEMIHLVGDPPPDRVIAELFNIDPLGQESGESETHLGNGHYRLTFRKQSS